MLHNISIRHTLLAVLLTTCAAQLNIGLFADGFKVAMGICAFTAAAYLVPSLSMPALIVLSDLGVFVTRIIAFTASGFTWHDAIFFSLPEVAFYLVCGVLTWLIIHVTDHKINKLVYALLIAGVDFLSNFTELTIRLTLSGISSRILLVIASAALIRSGILLISIFIASEYRLTLLQRSNAEQYQNLMMLMAKLQGEVSWLEKGSAAVERIMTDAYDLYRSLDESGADRKQVRAALNISKDVHEVKKEYNLITRGIRDVIDTEPKDLSMDVKHLLMLIGETNLSNIADKSHRPDFDVICEDGLYTRKPYLILSLFNNLVVNAIEAFDDLPASGESRPAIEIRETREDDLLRFTVRDNGPGIPEDIVANIFDPGFSTKINFETGSVNRGLGLAIVRDIVTNLFQGRIDLETGPGGTTFTLTFPQSIFTRR